MYGITIVGNIASEINLRFTSTGKANCSFAVAVNRKVNGEEQVDFHRVACWGELAERVAELGKGCRIIAHGRLSSRSWEDADGNKRYVTELVADDLGPSARWADVTATRVSKSNDYGTNAKSFKPAAPASPKVPEYDDGTVPYNAPVAQPTPQDLEQVRDQIAQAKQAVRRPAAKPAPLPPPPAQDDADFNWSEEPF